MKFKVGDKVICKRPAGFSRYLVEGREYTISGTDGIAVSVFGSTLTFNQDRFELAKEEKPTLTPHKHQKEIIAWANGATIQVLSWLSGTWCDVADNNLTWNPEWSYRVKPDVDKVAEIEEEIAKLDATLGNLNKEANTLIKELDKLKGQL